MQAQPTQLSSRPSPSRAHPLSPIREPNTSAAPKEPKAQAKPATPPQPAAREEVPKELDIIVPEEKIIHEPPSSDIKAQSKAAEKKDKDKEKEEHKEGKEKEKEKDHHKEHKEKKEKDQHKEKEKDKDHHKEEKGKEHKKKKDKHKEEEHDEHKIHGGKLHKELTAGVADMVHKLGATAAPLPSAGHGHHDRHASGDVGETIVITLASENKGASMKVSTRAAEDAEGKDKERQRARGKLDGDAGKHEEARGLTTFVNSNVQVVNNSLVLQSSCNSSDPGVHLKLSAKSKKKGGDGEESGGGKGAAAVAAAKKK
jgi:hypothetical protein